MGEISEIASPRGPSRKARGERWDELIVAAARVFAEKGYEAASLQEIAEQVGMLKGSLYHYISGKSDLLVHVMREAHARGLRQLIALGEGGGPALARLETLVAAHARFVCTERTFTMTFITARRHLPAARQQEFAAEETAYRALCERLIAAAQDEGGVRPDLDPKLAALCLLGFLNALPQWVRPHGSFPVKRICDHAVAQALGGLRT